ncbi:PCI domain containing protein [Entamoeba marina]
MSFDERLSTIDQIKNKSIQIKQCSKDGNSDIKMINSLSNLTQKLIIITINIIDENGKDNADDVVVGTTDVLRELLSLINNHAKNATLPIVALSFHLFNKLHNYSQMGDFLTTTEHIDFDEMATPRGMFCMFHYYTGITQLLKGSMASSIDHLTKSYQYLPKNSINCRKVLIPLIALQLRKGKYPNYQLLQQHDLLSIYSEIILALRRGDITTYDAEVKKHETFFIQHGLFFLMESLKLIVYRNLFATVQELCKENKIFYSKFITALKFYGKECDCNELEYIMCNMISKKIMFGQLYHGPSVISLKPQEAFKFYLD